MSAGSVKEILIDGRPFIEFREKDRTGHPRLWNRCAPICQTGMFAGQMCIWKARSDSTAIRIHKGVHKHDYSIDAFVRNEVGIVSLELAEKYATFLARANISLRAGASSAAIDFINGVIRYGYALGRQRPEGLNASDYWDVNNRNKLKDVILEASDRILRREIIDFSRLAVSLTIDGATINRVEALDFMLIGHGYKNVCKTLLFKSVVMKRTKAEDYKRKVMRVVNDLDNKGLALTAIVADGLMRQRVAIDEKNAMSIQHERGGPKFLKNVVYVYCRCHLLNLVIKDWLELSRTANKCHKYIGGLAVRLRKREAREALGAVCPEGVETRFCYDFRLVAFVLRNHDAISQLLAVEGSSIPHIVFHYGCILEVIWHLIGCCERKNATLANTFESVVYAINRLDLMARDALESDPFLADNSRVVSLIMRKRLLEQYRLSCLAFSLTPRGRQFFRNQAGLDDPLLEKHHYDPWIWYYVKYGEMNDDIPQTDMMSVTEEDFSQDEEEEESFEEFELDPDSISYDGQFSGEHNQTMEKLKEDANYEYGREDIMEIAREYFTDRARGSDDRTQDGSEMFNSFREWMNLSNVDATEDDGSAFDYWQDLMYSPKSSAFAKIARSLVSIPCAEVANERCFSVKRRIVGRHSTTTSAELLTARTRIALHEMEERK